MKETNKTKDGSISGYTYGNGGECCYCEDCWNCFCCDELYYYNGMYLCYNCYMARVNPVPTTFVCSMCGASCDCSNESSIEGICSECYARGVFMCYSCGNYHYLNERNVGPDGRYYCDDCYTEPSEPDNNTFVCSVCGNTCSCGNESVIEGVCCECCDALPNCPICGKKVLNSDRFLEGYNYCYDCGSALTVSVIPSRTTVQVGSAVKLTATVSHGQNLPVSWRSSDTAKARVISNGTVVGRAAGTVTITASIPGGASDTAEITIVPREDTCFICSVCKMECPCANESSQEGVCKYCFNSSSAPGTEETPVTPVVQNTAYVDHQKHLGFDCGRAGSGSVRLMDGRLNFVHHDAAITTKGKPLVIAHCYDSCNAGTSSIYGNGWHLSFDQSIAFEDTDDFYGVYTDGNGCKHYLKQDESGEFYDTSGLGITFYQVDIVEGTDETPPESLNYIRDTKNNKMCFNMEGKLIEIQYVDGTVYSITYNGSGKISTISDAFGNSADLIYDDLGRLSVVYDFDDDRIEYSYSGNKLTDITYPSECFSDGSINPIVSRFGYDENGRLNRIEDVTGIYTSIRYYADGRVSGITVQGNTSVANEAVVLSDTAMTASDIEFIYGMNTASVTDKFKGTRTVYNLDGEGRELFAYEDSSVLPIEQRSEVTLSSLSGYVDKAHPISLGETTGKLVGVSACITAAASQATNRLTNSAFSSTSGWTVYGNGASNSGIVTEGFVNGKNSYRLYSNNNASQNKLTQTLEDFSSLEGNVYVASVWAKASGATQTIADNGPQFALKVIVYQDDANDPIVYRANLDPSKDGQWQYAAIPIGASPNYSKIEYVLDYSGNTGTCMFSNPMLIAIDGTERYTFVNSEKTEDYGLWNFYAFNKLVHIIKRVDVIEGIRSRQEFYDYNYNLVKVIEKVGDSNEFVTESRFNPNNTLSAAEDKYGNEIYYTYDDFGNVTEIHITDSTGKHEVKYTKREYEGGYYLKSETDPRYRRNSEILKTEYTFNEVNNLLEKYKDTNGQEYHYAYDDDTGDLLRLSTSVNGTNLENRFKYTNSYLTSVSHNGFDYRFEYDKLGRTAAVSVGGMPLFTKSYMISSQVDTENTIYATGELETIFTDRRGNPTMTVYNDRNGDQSFPLMFTYDYLGRVSVIVDNVSNVKYNYTYNTDGSISSIKKYNADADITTDPPIAVDLYSYDQCKRLTSKVLGEVVHTYLPIYERDSADVIYPDDNVIGVKLDGKFTDTVGYDGHRRVGTRTLSLNNGTPLISDSYAYYTAPVYAGIGSTCDYVNSLTTTVNGNDKVLSYTYDKAGNIETVSENNVLLAKYYYDGINRLVREDNAAANKTYTWSYDVGGNITEKRTYAYTANATPGGTCTTVSYGYASTGWKDRLTSFNGQSITYDEIGNPTMYKGNELTWTHVRRLASYGSNNRFKYDANGIRTEKNDIRYILEGNKILGETDDCLWDITYYYGTNGVVGFNYDGADYYYRKNLQGDVIAIYTASGTLVAEYVYDAWGKIIHVKDANGNVNTNNNFIGNINPFRYRSYYYDTETGLYYLNSRYYDPETGRFINADDIQCLDPETLGGINLYAYCLDNPVNMIDPAGNAPKWLEVAGWIGLGVGLILCAVAIGVLTGGVGTATLLGAIAVGAAKGALVGAAIGVGAGALSGGIGALASGEELGNSEFWSDVAFGAMLGFGAGAVVGAIAGGFYGANGWYNAKALEFTNYGSNEVVLGRSPGYVEIAKSRGATYFHTTDEVWNTTQAMKGVGTKGMWRINKAFLNQQIKAGAHFTLANPSSGFLYAKEVAYIMKHGVYAFL